MRPVRSRTTSNIKRQFLAELNRLEGLYDTLIAIRPTSRNSSNPVSWRQTSDLCEGVFLRAFLGWEEFQERLFLSYLMGKRRPDGRAVGRYFIPKSSKHARKIYLDSRGLSDWTEPEVVIQRADLVFREGRPFRDALLPRITVLQQLKTIRNAIAHRSGPAQARFERLVRDAISYLPPGTTPGSFLVSRSPHGTNTQIENYLDELRGAIQAVAP